MTASGYQSQEKAGRICPWSEGPSEPAALHTSGLQDIMASISISFKPPPGGGILCWSPQDMNVVTLIEVGCLLLLCPQAFRGARAPLSWEPFPGLPAAC